MPQRDHRRSSAPGQVPLTPLARRSASPVLALQQAVGNRGTGQVLARKEAGRGTAENSVRVGKLGSIEIVESNIGDWIGKKADAEDLVVTTAKGKHSEQLKSLSDTRGRVDTIEVQTITGQNSWVIVTFKNARITGYTSDTAGETERWKAIRFDAVDIKRTSIGKPRP